MGSQRGLLSPLLPLQTGEGWWVVQCWDFWACFWLNRNPFGSNSEICGKGGSFLRFM
ncbi:hypothetical protein Sjap_000108 [Stephania japonica]|uniref:Uncharacterized protein n=1 Tax=Stephania japonica TaxID=461633 RepID=A0AAP0KJ01_9MAGN